MKTDRYKITEKWKPINGFEDFYFVSNLGNVKSFKIRRATDKIRKKFIILKPQKRKGYLSVTLYKNKIPKMKAVHRLVVNGFIDNHNNLPQVNHKDGNKTNNNLDNLEWCTAKQNIIHSYKNKLQIPLKGIDKATKLKENDVVRIRNMSLTNQKIADLFNISKSHVSNIKNRKVWKHVI